MVLLILITDILDENIFGVKLYNPAPDKSNFTVTLLTGGSPCNFIVFGEQTVTEHSTHVVDATTKHFLGIFKEMKRNEQNGEGNECSYTAVSDENWYFVYVQVFNVQSSDDLILCEITLS